jgi:hypothetical protein
MNAAHPFGFSQGEAGRDTNANRTQHAAYA